MKGFCSLIAWQPCLAMKKKFLAPPFITYLFAWQKDPTINSRIHETVISPSTNPRDIAGQRILQFDPIYKTVLVYRPIVMIKQSCNLIGWKRLIGPKLKYSVIVNHNNFHFKISQVKISKKKIGILRLIWVLFITGQIVYKMPWKYSNLFLCRPAIF